MEYTHTDGQRTLTVHFNGKNTIHFTYRNEQRQLQETTFRKGKLIESKTEPFSQLRDTAGNAYLWCYNTAFAEMIPHIEALVPDFHRKELSDLLPSFENPQYT
jgi:hypothetical protein